LNGTVRTADGQVAIMNAAGGWRYENSTGDFNGDGKTDLLFQNDITHGIAVWQMNGTQLAADGQIAIMNAGGGWHFVDVADFTATASRTCCSSTTPPTASRSGQMDGLHIDHDAVVGTIYAAGGWYYADKGTSTATARPTAVSKQYHPRRRGLAMDGNPAYRRRAGRHHRCRRRLALCRTGDFNGDGKTDLLMLNDTTHSLAIWQMNGTQSAANAQVGSFWAAGGWRFVDVADFNGDGKSDLCSSTTPPRRRGLAVGRRPGYRRRAGRDHECRRRLAL